MFDRAKIRIFNNHTNTLKMKNIFITLIWVAIFFISVNDRSYGQNQFGFFGSAVYLETDGVGDFYNCYGNNIGTKPFSGNLGDFAKGTGSLRLLGAEMKTWKNSGANVCEPILYYRLTSGSFTGVSLPWMCNCVSGAFPCGGGSCSGNDQKWQKNNYNYDLTTLDVGSYTLEVYFEIPGQHNGSGCTDVLYDNNSGSNYTISFSVVQTLDQQSNHFTAVANDHATVLSWNGEKYTNILKWNLEKSENGIDFTHLATINNMPGNDDYTYLDESMSKVCYYKLQSVYSNGNDHYSQIIKVVRKDLYSDILISPNPTSDIIQISGISEPVLINLLDYTGRSILTKEAESDTQMDVSMIAPGMYIIKVSSLSKTQLIKIIRQ